jgi:hypothetical protein
MQIDFLYRLSNPWGGMKTIDPQGLFALTTIFAIRFLSGAIMADA